jgi:hypothetical protein
MLTGRINWRHGAVILGCFILFGAASIVAGIRAAASAVLTPPWRRTAPRHAVCRAHPPADVRGRHLQLLRLNAVLCAELFLIFRTPLALGLVAWCM